MVFRQLFLDVRLSLRVVTIRVIQSGLLFSLSLLQCRASPRFLLTSSQLLHQRLYHFLAWSQAFRLPTSLCPCSGLDPPRGLQIFAVRFESWVNDLAPENRGLQVRIISTTSA